jgi:protein O-GlcNAc transferase
VNGEDNGSECRATLATAVSSMSSENKRLALEQLHKGTLRHRAGEISLAQSHYQRAAKLDPSNGDAWHLLGVASLQTGALPLAVKHLRTCVKVSPKHAEAHNNLGVALRRLGKHSESIGAFRAALRARERYVEAAYNLALALESTGDVAGAEQAYRHALIWRDNYVDAAINLGNLLRRQNRYAEALPLLETAQRLAPDRAQTNGNLAALLADIGRPNDAVRFAQTATLLEPQHAAWWRGLGVAQRLQHDIERAITSLQKAVSLANEDDVARIELGMAQQEAGAIEDARSNYAAVTRPPAGSAERVRWTAALSLPAIYRNDAEVDAERARFSQGLTDLEAGLKLDSRERLVEAYHAVCGVTPFHLHYQPRDNTDLQKRFGDLVARVMTAIAPEFAEKCAWQPREHGERVRVGIVSSHLMQHTVSRYFSTLITALDPERFDVRVWYSGEKRDASTDFIASKVGQFVYANDDALASARSIKSSQLDVLIYPEIGMDPRHQVLAALRLAPVQCALYGHPATTGAANIDFFLSGDAFEPPNAQQQYRERLVRLPGIGTLPTPPPEPGDGAWFDAYAANAPLLLCLQNYIKLVPEFDAALARIASQSGARIGFFTRNPPLERRFRARIEESFRAQNIDPARHLVFLPVQKHADYLAGIARAPLVLDSPWFSGGSTSLDAFSVGTPVLAWQGAMARGRQTSGMLRMMGVDELIANDADDYVAKCVALVGNKERLTTLRTRLLGASRRLFEDAAVMPMFEEFLSTAKGSDGER